VARAEEYRGSLILREPIAMVRRDQRERKGGDLSLTPGHRIRRLEFGLDIVFVVVLVSTLKYVNFLL